MVSALPLHAFDVLKAFVAGMAGLLAGALVGRVSLQTGILRTNIIDNRHKIALSQTCGQRQPIGAE